MLKIREEIDLKWLAGKFELRYTKHCDEAGMYLFYSDTLYINPYDRIIHIEGRNPHDILFLYDLIKADLVVKESEEK